MGWRIGGMGSEGNLGFSFSIGRGGQIKPGE